MEYSLHPTIKLDGVQSDIKYSLKSEVIKVLFLERMFKNWARAKKSFEHEYFHVGHNQSNPLPRASYIFTKLLF